MSGADFFMLGQCRVKFDFKQTLPRNRPKISIAFNVSGLYRVRLTGPHDKSSGWAFIL